MKVIAHFVNRDHLFLFTKELNTDFLAALISENVPVVFEGFIWYLQRKEIDLDNMEIIITLIQDREINS